MKTIKKLEEKRDTYKYYMYEVIEQLKDVYEEQKEKVGSITQKAATQKEINLELERDLYFALGSKMSYYRVLERFRNNAKAWSIPLKEIGLEEEITLD